jgi:hypothetical protein
MHRLISEITIGERCRKDMGDIAGLATSIDSIGLLHPVVIDKQDRLIAGARRIKAFEALGKNKIPVTVVDLDAIVRGEYAENAIRKNFSLKEVFAIYEAAFPAELEAAKARQAAGKGTDGSGGRGKKKNLGETDAKVSRAPRAVDRVGTFAGVSGRTLEKVIVVM